MRPPDEVDSLTSMRLQDDLAVPHTIIDGYAPRPMILAAAATWPDDRWQWWHRYNTAHQSKLATMGEAPFPPASRMLLERMATLDVSEIEADAFPDLTFHGAGMHTLPAGGFLKDHVDAEIHPLTGWSRVLNAILFIEGDGSLRLGSGGEVVVDPIPGRLGLFPTEGLKHGVGESTVTRKTLAVYWWAVRGGDGNRTAEFGV